MDIFGGAWLNYWEDIESDWRDKVGQDDLVLIAGDISWGMTLKEAEPDIVKISRLPGKKVIVRGNHDYWWSSYSQVKSALPEGMFAIQNNALRFENFVVAGTRGWQVLDEDTLEHDKQINLREQIRLRLTLTDLKNKLKEGDTPILMLHYPPFNAAFADSEFTAIIEEFKVSTVVYGHLHGKQCRSAPLVQKNGVNYYLTSCDQIQNKLVKLF